MPTDQTLNISLKNNTDSPNLFVTITGLALDRGNTPVLIKSDGITPYYPASPSQILQPLGADCAIYIGRPGSTRTITIPRIAGGRVWFCKDGPLTFLLNPGPAVVEPSMMNPSDPNYNLNWGFAEFTYNDFQLFVNVSYVDFVSIPVSLTLETKAGEKMSVEGMPGNALDTVCQKLIEQDSKDGAGWSKLVVRKPGSNSYLRALSPNSGRVISGGSMFAGYYAAYVAAVYEKYRYEDIIMNTQTGWGNLRGRVGANGLLAFGGQVGSFAPPSAADIFSCDSGPFARGADWTEARGNVGARLAAAFNRSMLRFTNEHPNGESVQNYYREPVTNHYARICHETSLGGRGYAFPYDDVGANGSVDQSGSLWHSEPRLLTVGIGGGF